MSAKKKAAAANDDQAALALAHAANAADDEAEQSSEPIAENTGEAGELIYLNQEATAIFKYLRGHRQADIDSAVKAIDTLRIGKAEKEVQELTAALAAKVAALEALTGVSVTEGKNPAIKRKRGPNKPKEGAPTVDAVVAYLKSHGHTSKQSAVRKGEIVKGLGCSDGQWAKVIKDAVENSKRVSTNGVDRPMTAYYANGK